MGVATSHLRMRFPHDKELTLECYLNIYIISGGLCLPLKHRGWGPVLQLSGVCMQGLKAKKKTKKRGEGKGGQNNFRC